MNKVAWGRRLAGFLAAGFCCGFLLTAPPPACAAGGEVGIVINGRTVPAGDQPPVVAGQRVYVPLRVVGENLGCNVQWLSTTKQVVIRTPGASLGSAPDRPGRPQDIQIVIDGKVLEIPSGYGQPMVTKAQRVVVPLRAVGEALGCTVQWVKEGRKVEIRSVATEPSRGDGRDEDGEPPQPPPGGDAFPPGSGEEQSQPSSELLAKLASYRTNLRLLDNTLINSADLAGKRESDFSAQQLAQFKTYLSQLEKYPPQVTLPDGKTLATADVAIRGRAIATADQLRAWIAKETPRIRAKMEQQYGRPFLPIPDLADLYLKIGAEYGIRGDIAFAQAAKETFYWQFTGSVQSFQNNYCGLWATGSPLTGRESLNGADPSLVRLEPGLHGATFATPEAGVEAHIQHLYAYATKDPLPPGKKLLSPRFNLVQRGCAPTWQALNGRWAVPGTTYGQSIIHDYWLPALAADK